MAKEDFSERLRALEDRVKAAGSSRARGGGAQDKFTQGSLAWRMVIELVAGMLLGLAIGYGLDSLFGTRPVFLMLFAILGFAAGVRTMVRTAEEVRRRRAEGARLGAGEPEAAVPAETRDGTDPEGPREG
jgi:ATP synthase protein I